MNFFKADQLVEKVFERSSFVEAEKWFAELEYKMLLYAKVEIEVGMEEEVEAN